MALFGKKKSDSGPSTPPASRQLRQLNPDFFQDVHTALIQNGGTDSEAAVAVAVRNAIFNTGSNYLEKLGDRRAQKEFENQFGATDPSDRDAPDRIIDWLLDYDAGTEEFLTTLVGRLQDVLSRPA